MTKSAAGGRVKHTPIRTCIGCRQAEGKRTFVRIVRTPQGVVVDPTGKLAGRGAYVHRSPACWEAAPKGRRMGHAGAIVSAFGEAASEKVEILQECGVVIAPTPSEMGVTVQKVLGQKKAA